MAYSLGPKVIAGLTMESAAEASIPKPELLDPDEDSATGSNAEAAPEKETKDLMPVQIPNPGKAECDPDAGNAASNINVAGSSKASTAGGIEHKIDNLLVVQVADVTVKIRLKVTVNMISPLLKNTDKLIHGGHFMLVVGSTTTIRQIKYKITSTFNICYEDMALVCNGKNLCDARSVEFYFSNNEHALDLQVKAPNTFYKKIFDAFIMLGLVDEKAWFASRSIIHIMHTKYRVPVITLGRLIYRVGQRYIPDVDDSDYSSADCSCEYEDDELSNIDDYVTDIEEDEMSDLNDEEESDHDESDID